MNGAAQPRRTQAERRARTRNALLESAARGLSRHGYANLVLEQVARDAGYTRGALYHLFASKEDLALAVCDWVGETWYAEVGYLLTDHDDPVAALRAVARGHAVYCRRDIARVLMTLRLEFSGQDHPVGRIIQEAGAQLVIEVSRLITAARRRKAIPSGPPSRVLARAYLGALEGVTIQLAGQTHFDAELVERAVVGLLGLAPRPASGRSTSVRTRASTD